MKPSLLLTLFVAALAPFAYAKDPETTTFDFNADTTDNTPKGFEFGRTGKGAVGKWLVKADKDAPGAPSVLVQTDADDTDYRFPIAVTGPAQKNLRLSVKCKTISGKVDQACGLIFRVKDADNYYVVRANALEDNIRLYHVVKGNRVQFESWSGKVKSGVWHQLSVEAKGDLFQVFFNGKKIMEAHDKTFSDAGKFGVWTKADSVTAFDDLHAEPL